MTNHDQQLANLLPRLVESKVIPQFIYKYQRIDDHTDDLFINSNLWFSNPLDFNDPFDCQLTIDSKNTLEEIVSWMKKADPKMSTIDRINIAKETKKNPKKWHEMVNQNIRKHLLRTGVCCFAKNPFELLMWAHYTNCHKGFCMEFDVLADPMFFGKTGMVKYKQDYPRCNYLREQKDFINKAILTKSIHWEYEGEFRVINFNKQGLVSFERKALTKIIFGCKSSDNDISHIKSLIANNNYLSPNFQKATVSTNEYKLELNDLQ